MKRVGSFRFRLRVLVGGAMGLRVLVGGAMVLGGLASSILTDWESVGSSSDDIKSGECSERLLISPHAINAARGLGPLNTRQTP